MQQTQTYKLNLLETSDAFSPSPLNENMEKVEGALLTKTDAASHAADIQALDGRIAALEVRKIVIGTYTGSGSGGQHIDLGFTPTVVIARSGEGDRAVYAGPDAPYTYNFNSLSITPGGFSVNFYAGNQNMNYPNKKYPFIAFA